MFGWLTQVLIFIWNPHREWFYEREKYNGGNVFLGDESIPKIIGHARVKLLLKDRRTKTLPFVLHILDMVRNLISSNKMSDVVVYTIFEKDRWKMVQGAMLLVRGPFFLTLYKLLGRIVINECNNSFVLERKNEEIRFPNVFEVDTMFWHQGILHIG